MANIIDERSKFIFYASEEGSSVIKVYVEDKNTWVTQAALTEIFGVSKSTISEHLKNIFEEGELIKNSTVRKFRTVQKEGSREVARNVEYYNLDAIISVGYRVNSYKAMKFRIWATSILKEYMLKGFAMDDERLKQGKALFGKDHFDELLERIRDIRASERRFYQKVTDIYIHCSYDYDKNSPITQNFFAHAQNKLDYAENLAEKGIRMSMADWQRKLDLFLKFNEYQILEGFGSVKKSIADERAKLEYKKFKPIQEAEYRSDFDKAVEVIKSTGSLPKETHIKLKENISGFDKKLKQALDYNPKD